MNEYGFNTGLLHGTNEKYPQGATQVPIYQSSAFRHDSAEDLEKIFDNKKMGFSYTRINNPTVESFEKRVTMLEDGIGSVACASGMAALTNAFLNILQAGDEIVAACGLYGGTVELFDDLKPFGISVKLSLIHISDHQQRQDQPEGCTRTAASSGGMSASSVYAVCKHYGIHQRVCPREG